MNSSYKRLESWLHLSNIHKQNERKEKHLCYDYF